MIWSALLGPYNAASKILKYVDIDIRLVVLQYNALTVHNEQIIYEKGAKSKTGLQDFEKKNKCKGKSQQFSTIVVMKRMAILNKLEGKGAEEKSRIIPSVAITLFTNFLMCSYFKLF